ncbi:UbiA family prenyltransferase [Aridibaculum aurantiacum]|uniref:UbiA family prenyltransferase n=1 Tax=Aridibaculum aurantiacum TaxID=2810307 RepID=UPI001F601BEC|nr:UbiA family prenyltransferase [Aridibaculum aurantiacum]
MLSRSTIQLLRIPFSYFLMPVYWFALSFAGSINIWKAILVFIILHLLLYPSSNGYNSYMDKDETSIGGLANPLQPTRQLFVVTISMDVLAVLLSCFVSLYFAIGVIFYITCSRLYSYRGVRLKQYPVIGYLTVIANQGALVFWLVWHGVQPEVTASIPWQGLVAASFLIGGFYPITQVYQHEADAKDGVITISMKLGKPGTFIFCGAMYLVAFFILFLYFRQHEMMNMFLVMNLFFLPVIIYFLWWMMQVWKQPENASFKKTMNMNWLASTCTSLAFITIIFLQHRG